MKYRIALLLSLLALTAAAFVGCDSANPVAPTGTVLTVTANPTQISLNGTSTITVVGFRPDGNPLNTGTQVTLTTDLGNLPSVVTVDSQGRATAILTADGRTGEATITANLTSGGGETGGATAKVQIGESDTTLPTLSISTSPTTINIEQESTITVIVRNPDQTLRAGESVRLRTTLGVLDQTELVTDSAGEAKTILRPDGRSGSATITGTTGSGSGGSGGGSDGNGGTVSGGVTVLGSQVTLSVNPAILNVGEQATLTILVRDTNGVALAKGHTVQLTATLGNLGRDQVTTNSAGRATTSYTAGDLAGSDTITAFLDNSDNATSSITIRDAPASFTFNVSDSEINNQGATVTLTVSVVNSDSVALGGVLVRFGVDNAGGTFTPAQSVTTNPNGIATVDVTFSQTDLNGRSFVDVTATVRVAGEDKTETRRLTVSGN